MSLVEHLQPWSGATLRHIPADSPMGVLDFRFAAQSPKNRWNTQGSPTLYLAGDEGVLIAEWGRHFAVRRVPGLEQITVARSVFHLELTLDHVLDLRSAPVCEALSLANAPWCFADLDLARATAQFVRSTTAAQGILVPAMAFLDDPSRWCLVVFLEKLPADPAEFISSVVPAGPLRWG
ncbi:MAG: RES family NAD+ phosphorylase [Thermomicrobiales bacterium]|nr:RES family NAD+ phosphorylase [Thermomicrobiales bacterium]